MYTVYAASRRGDAECGKLSRVRLGAVQKDVSELFDLQYEHMMRAELSRREYEPLFRPDDDELLELAFDLPAAIAGLLKTTPADMPDLVFDDSSKVVAATVLIAVDASSSRVCFQAVEKRSWLAPGRVLFFNKNSHRLSDSPGLALGTKLDAVHENGKLYFTSEARVRQFLSLDKIFTDATDSHVEHLLSKTSHFTGFTKDLLRGIKTNVRRKITYIVRSTVLADVSAKQMIAAAKACDVHLNEKNGTILIPSDPKELALLLKFLSEDILKSPLRDKLFESNSKRPREGGATKGTAKGKSTR